MSRTRPPHRGDGQRPRFTSLAEFLRRNGIDPLDYLHEVLGEDTAMPTPLKVAGQLCIETEREVHWRNRTIVDGIVRFGELSQAGGRRDGRR